MPTPRLQRQSAVPPAAPDKTRTFLARYGATVLRGGIAAIPTALFTYQALLDLSPQEVWFISYILAHKWDEDLPYPSLRKMAERTGLSVRQLHRIKDAVVEKGYLVLVPRRRADDGGQDSNAYDFGGLFGRIEELLRADGRGVAEAQQAPYSDSGPSSAGALSHNMTAPSSGGTLSHSLAAHRPAPRAAVVPARPTPASGPSPGAVTLATSGEANRESAGPVTLATSGAVTNPSPPPGTRKPPGRGTAPPPPAVTESPPAPVSVMAPEKRASEKQPRIPPKREESNPLSPYVMAVASDLTRELGDSAHEPAKHLARQLAIIEPAAARLGRLAEQDQRALAARGAVCRPF